MSEAETDTLSQALARHSIELPPELVERLDAYCRELWDWNAKLNLTRHTTYEKFVSRDLLDSLELSKLLQQSEEVLDIGSGGGVPGIVLAILRPDLQMSLSESVGKKAQALTRMVEALDLSVAVHACRAEDALEDLRFDSVIARAVGPLDKILRWVEPHWLQFRRLLVVKGPRWVDEQANAQRQGALRDLVLRQVAQYPLPGTESDSVILEVSRL